MTAYYNEIDPYCAAWLRNLIAAKHLPAGDVDERDIRDVPPGDVAGYTQAHFFAGVGGWGLAARLAGWPDDRPLWTGSCPCQPFSVAGKGAGQADARHLWPEFFRLIAACRPAVVMGEQVAAAVGKDWLDGVSTDLEGIGYACGAAVVPACAVDAPHRRDRLWFVAHAEHSGRERRNSGAGCGHPAGTVVPSGAVALADADSARSQILLGELGDARAERTAALGNGWGGAGALVNAASERRGEGRAEHALRGGRSAAPGASFWSSYEWLLGADGKARRVEPGIRLLAHGIPARVAKLRAFGNAIVPQLAAEILAAFMECAP